MTTNPTPTPAAEWKRAREEGHAFTLPSGKAARFRTVALDALIASGKIPNLLIPVVAKMLWASVGRGEDDTAQDSKEFLEIVHVIVKAAMLEPTVVDNPQAAGEISLEDIEFGDKLAVFNLSRLTATVLEKFLREQNGDVDALSAGKNVQPETEPIDADYRVLDSIPV